MVTFEEAYEAAAARYSEEAWWDLRPTAVIGAILDAMKRLGAEQEAGATWYSEETWSRLHPSAAVLAMLEVMRSDGEVWPVAVS
jgi:uncharacterized protein YbdZ (MbtH family)